MENEKLVVSLLMACHHPGGKNSRSPGASTAVTAVGSTCWTKAGNCFKSFSRANTSTWDVLPISELGRRSFDELSDIPGVNGYIDGVTDGGANQTDLKPTTCTVGHFLETGCILIWKPNRHTIAVVIGILRFELQKQLSEYIIDNNIRCEQATWHLSDPAMY